MDYGHQRTYLYVLVIIHQNFLGCQVISCYWLVTHIQLIITFSFLFKKTIYYRYICFSILKLFFNMHSIVNIIFLIISTVECQNISNILYMIINPSGIQHSLYIIIHILFSINICLHSVRFYMLFFISVLP